MQLQKAAQQTIFFLNRMENTTIQEISSSRPLPPPTQTWRTVLLDRNNSPIIHSYFSYCFSSPFDPTSLPNSGTPVGFSLGRYFILLAARSFVFNEEWRLDRYDVVFVFSFFTIIDTHSITFHVPTRYIPNVDTTFSISLSCAHFQFRIRPTSKFRP